MPKCECNQPGAGRVEINLHFNGRFLFGKATITRTEPGGDRLFLDPLVHLKARSWEAGDSCQQSALSGECERLPSFGDAPSLQFEFALHHREWTEKEQVLAFFSPLLFTVGCPHECRLPVGAWPVRFTLTGFSRQPDAPFQVQVWGLPEGPLEKWAWEQPSASLAMVLHREPHAELQVGERRILGISQKPVDRTLPLLHPFVEELAIPGKRLVVLDESIRSPEGFGHWRLVSAPTQLDVATAATASRFPAWISAPAHAREGAIRACALMQLPEPERLRWRKRWKKEYLDWIQRRAMDSSRNLSEPVSYWALLFPSLLQTGPEGFLGNHCEPLMDKEKQPVRMFHEIMEKLEGNLPEDILHQPQFVTVRVVSTVARPDAVLLKLFNTGRISLWVPVRYSSTEGTWNHWLFLPASGKTEEFKLQYSGKPVNILIDPEDVTAVLPFGWTGEGPPEDLDDLSNAAPGM